jgi:hypothetical protein
MPQRHSITSRSYPCHPARRVLRFIHHLDKARNHHLDKARIGSLHASHGQPFGIVAQQAVSNSRVSSFTRETTTPRQSRSCASFTPHGNGSIGHCRIRPGRLRSRIQVARDPHSRLFLELPRGPVDRHRTDKAGLRGVRQCVTLASVVIVHYSGGTRALSRCAGPVRLCREGDEVRWRP